MICVNYVSFHFSYKKLRYKILIEIARKIYILERGDNNMEYELDGPRENARALALARQDCLLYAALCDSVGVAPEDFPLYEQGIAERRWLESEDARLEIENGTWHYTDFLKDSINRGAMVRRYGTGIELKAELLIKYFPEKFGSGKLSDIWQYEDDEIGRKFARQYTTAERVALKTRRDITLLRKRFFSANGAANWRNCAETGNWLGRTKR